MTVSMLHTTAPGIPTISVNSTTTTTISISWTTAGSVVNSYEVMWRKNISKKCHNVDEGRMTIINGSTRYTISELEEDSNYTITVTATNAAGSAVNVPVTGMTREAGEGLSDIYELMSIQILYFLPAPSAPPTIVSTSDVTNSSITVHWGPVDCIHHIGDITGYSVQYVVKENGSFQTMNVSGGATTETTISGLMASTTYSIQVAVVNTINIGVYNVPLFVITQGKIYIF